MRVAILLGCIIIADAIIYTVTKDVKTIYSDKVSNFLGIIIIVSMLMDVVDFLRSKK